MDKRFYIERREKELLWEENQHLPLFHGVRIKNPERIRKEGICSFRTMVDMRMEIRNALRHFGKEKLLYTARGRSEFIRTLVNVMADPRRRVIYLTSAGRDAACSWASTNPLFIYDTLRLAGVDKEIELEREKKNIFRYLTETYGEPYVIKLKETYPILDRAISSHQRCLMPEEILRVEKC